MTDNYVDSLTRYKIQREFKKAQKKHIKEYTPKIGEKAAKRLIKVASRRLNQRGIENATETIDQTDISDTNSTQSPV
jgi:hypothetical protein